MIDKEKSKALKELGLKEWQVFTVAGDTEYILLENVISVFSRQKAEIERLKVATEEVVSCFHRMESLYNIKCMELKVAKAEAVKEFAEKVSNTPWYRINSQGKLVVGANSETDIPLYKAEDIDNLLKETAGDTVKVRYVHIF